MRIKIFINLVISILIVSSFGEAINLSIVEENQIKLDNKTLEIQNEIINKDVDWIADSTSFDLSSNFFLLIIKLLEFFSGGWVDK